MPGWLLRLERERCLQKGGMARFHDSDSKASTSTIVFRDELPLGYSECTDTMSASTTGESIRALLRKDATSVVARTMHQARSIPKRAKRHTKVIRKLVPESIPQPGQRSKDQIQAIQAFCELADPSELVSYLERHAAARRVMVEAIEVIPKYFPEFRKATARFRPNYDSPAFPYIAVRIDTGVDANQARSLRETFDEEWWIPELPSVHGELLIDVEYR